MRDIVEIDRGRFINLDLVYQVGEVSMFEGRGWYNVYVLGYADCKAIKIEIWDGEFPRERFLDLWDGTAVGGA